MEREDIAKLHRGDYVLVKCNVEAVFVESGMVCVSTRDCDDGFDAYLDEVVSVCGYNMVEVGTQLSSGLEKNSKKLEKEATKNDLGVDCIDRQATLDAIIKRLGIKNETYLLQAERAIYQQILAMPSVTPQEPRCKDCKWWKDSDGEYRRGCGAESICRINTDKVYQGEGYCYLFEPQEREDNK